MVKEKIIHDLKEFVKNKKIVVKSDYYVEIPKVSSQGDYSTNIAMTNSKHNKMEPLKLAETVCEYFSQKPYYKKVEVAGPGFVNFFFKNNFYYDCLQSINEAGLEYGKSDYGKELKVLIEFVSANPTGPLNIVSARAAAYGDTLYRIMNYAGFKPIREFYINDAGNQVDILAESLEIRYREVLGEENQEIPVGVYQGEYLIDLAKTIVASESSKLLHYSEKDRLDKLKSLALKEIHDMQVKSLEKFGVVFDNWVSEKLLRNQGVVEDVLSLLDEAKCIYESEDAIWFASTKFGDVKDRVLMKSDGEITYLVPDIAYHLTKYQRGFDAIIDVLGPDHHGHISKLLAALRALNYNEEKLEIVFLQQVNLFEQGEKVKMSKREGKIITMDDLINEVGKDAARYFFIEKKPNNHLNFDLELAKKQSSENPVYYIQYAHARICSILQKAKKEKISLSSFNKVFLKKLKKEEEIEIIKKLLNFPELIINTAHTREPHRLAFFTYELASLFHKYYQKCTVINKRYKELSLARIYLIITIMNVLKICLRLMGLSAPESMRKFKD